MQAFADRLSTIIDPKVSAVLNRLGLLYGLHEIIEHSGDFLEVRNILYLEKVQYSEPRFLTIFNEPHCQTDDVKMLEINV